MRQNSLIRLSFCKLSFHVSWEHNSLCIIYYNIPKAIDRWHDKIMFICWIFSPYWEQVSSCKHNFGNNTYNMIFRKYIITILRPNVKFIGYENRHCEQESLNRNEIEVCNHCRAARHFKFENRFKNTGP